MLKSILKITTPIILIAIIIMIGYKTYKDALDNNENPITLIPISASVILECKNIEEITKNLRNTNVWTQLLNINYIQESNKQITKINQLFSENRNILNTNSLLISLHKVVHFPNKTRCLSS